MKYTTTQHNAARIAALEEELEAARQAQIESEYDKVNDPVNYIGKLIYANKTLSGSFGYEYGYYGDTEKKRARQVLDIVGGDVDIAERVITDLFIT